MKAYLDDEKLIRVDVEKSFYGGQLDAFYVRRNYSELIPCTISHRFETEGHIYYDLICEKPLSYQDRLILVQDKGRAVPVESRWIVRSVSFQAATSSEKSLGSLCFPDHTDFAVWAPTASQVYLVYTEFGVQQIVPMISDAQGVYTVRLDRNCHGLLYRYLIMRGETGREIVDPYAKSTDANGTWGCVIDPTRIARNTVNYHNPKITDAVIYETNVRDFSSRLDHQNRGYFDCFGELPVGSFESGWAYLKYLGITHIQLQPVLDFATVEELDPSRRYNWGYDPVSYFALEGSYSSEPNDPMDRIQSFIRLVNRAHAHGFGVILDVVYNHLYDSMNNALAVCCPYYPFRYENGQLANGTGCGNDLDSKQPMIRKLIIDSLVYLTEMYDVDGFRFDLMGIMDIETMRMIDDRLAEVKEGLYLYGEGWHMRTPLLDEEKASMVNQHKIPNIGMFNDAFRDVLKGSAHDDQKEAQGYLSGDLSKVQEMAAVMMGSCVKNTAVCLFDSPAQSINQVETHDNATLWDKLSFACADSEADRLLRQRMNIACVLLAQGVPFLHAGMEFAGTKNGDTNSYMSSDKVNGLDWERMSTYRSLVDYTGRAVAFRKTHAQLRCSSAEEIMKVSTAIPYEDGRLCLNVGDLKILINATDHDCVTDEAGYRLIFDEYGLSNGSSNTQPKLSVWVLERKS